MKLKEMLIRSATGDEEMTLQLISKFQFLIKSYSRKLGEEDTYYDLQLKFLELLPLIAQQSQLETDAQIIAYVQQAIKNEYIALSKKAVGYKKAFAKLPTDPDQMQWLFTSLGSKTDDYSAIYLADLFAQLTYLERNAVIGIVICGYSAAEIARKLRCSRQNINQAKRSGLKKIKQMIK